MAEPKYVRLRLDAVKPDPNNPRRHTKEGAALIRKSVAEFGQYRPIVVNTNTNTIIAGHGLYEVLVELGWTEADFVLVDVTSEQAASMMITDNRSSELAEWDAPKLAKQLLASEGPEAFGFDQRDLKRLMQQMDRGDDNVKPTREVVCPKCSHHFSKKVSSGNTKGQTKPPAPGPGQRAHT